MGNRRLVRVKVQDTSGRPIPNARVFIESGPEPFPDIAALSDDHGEVLMRVPSAGQYGFVCAAEGFGTAHAMVVVVDEAPPTVVIELRPES
jgi:hypothetical protein